MPELSRSVSRGQTWVLRLMREGLMSFHISRIYVLECHGLCLKVGPESLALIGFQVLLHEGGLTNILHPDFRVRSAMGS